MEEVKFEPDFKAWKDLVQGKTRGRDHCRSKGERGSVRVWGLVSVVFRQPA